MHLRALNFRGPKKGMINYHIGASWAILDHIKCTHRLMPVVEIAKKEGVCRGHG